MWYHIIIWNLPSYYGTTAKSPLFKQKGVCHTVWSVPLLLEGTLPSFNLDGHSWKFYRQLNFRGRNFTSKVTLHHVPRRNHFYLVAIIMNWLRWMSFPVKLSASRVMLKIRNGFCLTFFFCTSPWPPQEIGAAGRAPFVVGLSMDCRRRRHYLHVLE